MPVVTEGFSTPVGSPSALTTSRLSNGGGSTPNQGQTTPMSRLSGRAAHAARLDYDDRPAADKATACTGDAPARGKPAEDVLPEVAQPESPAAQASVSAGHLLLSLHGSRSATM